MLGLDIHALARQPLSREDVTTVLERLLPGEEIPIRPDDGNEELKFCLIISKIQRTLPLDGMIERRSIPHPNGITNYYKVSRDTFEKIKNLRL